MSSKLSPQEFSALATLAQARRDNLRTLLRGTHVDWGKHAREKNAAGIVKDAGDLGKKVYSLVKGSSQAATAVDVSPAAVEQAGEQLISICSGLHSYSDVVQAVTSDAMHSAISEITPFLGILSSGFQSVKSWRAIFKDGCSLYKDSQAKLDVLPGDPEAAAKAVIHLLQRKLANDSVSAARATAALTSKIAGLFVDLGTGTTAAIGVASTAASLAQKLAMVGLDFQQMQAGNRLLADPGKIDAHVFEVCPILGCYIIVCSDTSNVLNFFIADIGLPGWMDHVEKMQKNSLQRLTSDANKFILSSNLHLENAPTNKGIAVRKTFAQKINAAFHSLVKTKAKTASA